MRDPYIPAVAGVCICVVGGISSFITLVISFMSWLIVPKWRTFKNYVFLNIIFAFNTIYCVPIALIFTDIFSSNKVTFFALDILMNFFMFASCCWLMVMAMLFYVDLVKVFGNTMTRKVLKCNLFGWGLPLTISLGKVIFKVSVFMNNTKLLGREDLIVNYHDFFYYEEIVENIVLFALLGINFSVYIRVVFSLMKKANFSNKIGGNRAQKLQVATLAFIMSGILLMVSILMTILMLVGDKDKYYLYPLGLAAFGVQTAVINVCFLRSKANRDVWNNYMTNIKRQRQIRKEESKMEEIQL